MLFRDFTGLSILKTLLKKVQEMNIPIYDNQFVSELLIENNTCFGAMSFDILLRENRLLSRCNCSLYRGTYKDMEKVHQEIMKIQVMDLFT